MAITKSIALGIGFVSFILVAMLDATTLPHISFLLLHLLPVLFVTWHAGPRWGIFFATAMTASQAITSVRLDIEITPRYYWYLDLASDFTATVLLVWMQSMLRSTYEQINRLASHDTLTGIANRSGFYELLQAELNRKKRYDRPFTLIYFDCDNFKLINDEFGHHTGEALLVEVSSTLRLNLRRVDVPGRLGGDEFVVLLPETGMDAAKNTVTHLKTTLDCAMQGKNWPVTFSIGAATFERPPDSIDQAIEFADVLMYDVKKSGKDNILFRSFQ
jgi:diguanylate cyclase (GGDEF)-like protein